LIGSGCGGGPAGRTPPPLDQDYAGNFTGTWQVTGTIQMASFSETTSGIQEVTSPARNVLLFPGACPGGQALRAVVTGPSTFEFDRLVCSQTESCGRITVAFEEGEGTLSDGRVSATLRGRATGCGQDLPYTFSFFGSRDPTAPIPGGNPAPVVASLNPSAAVSGGPAFTLTVGGAGFLPSSTVYWNGNPRPTTFVSATELQAAIAGSDIAFGRAVAVTVVSPPPGGGPSNAWTFTVTDPVPAPTIGAIAPASVRPGSPRFTLTVTGSGFVPSSFVTWNGSPRPTTFVSASELHATIEAADVTLPGSAAIAVTAPAPGSGVAAAPPVTIADTLVVPTAAVAYQLDPAHSGRAVFGRPLMFPDSPSWTVTLDGAVSYPLIAAGKVFVVTRNAGDAYGTWLRAVDLATGAIVWGPIAIPGTYYSSGHAYDGGKLFVVTFDGQLRSFDAATGAEGWSVDLPLQYAFRGPPVATGGVVYVSGQGSGGTLYAVNQANGAILWTRNIDVGDGSPAVSPDGVFVSAPCQVYKIDLLTGSTLWHHAGPCSGGGGTTPAYANGSLYVRDPGMTVPTGIVHDAFSGTSVGAFGDASRIPIPALGATRAFVTTGGKLRGMDLDMRDVAWTFDGDGRLASAPIVIEDVVFVGSASGDVYAVDAGTGSQRWLGEGTVEITSGDDTSRPLTGLGAGEGYLVVPAGSTLTAWRVAGP
jgi:outer membrane protein assembly factor BamB